MSQENVDVARAFFTAWNRRDSETLADLVAQDGELLLPRNLLEGGSYRGPDGARRTLADSLETWDEVVVDIEAIREAEDKLLVLSRTVNTPKGGGPRTENQTAYLMAFRDGKIVHLLPYMSHAEALEAVGLSE